MGISACFSAVDTATLKRLSADPDSIADFLNPDGGDGVPPNYTDVDKAWHAIHYMLNGVAMDGTDDPLSHAIMGGEEVGAEVGYGPARMLGQGEVRAIAVALAALPEADFASRYDPAAMDEAQVYPAGIWARDGADGLDYVMFQYRQLLEFYRSAAERGDGAILWMA